ncbi:MAG TPA: hypothetical protein VJ951_14935, partial [Bacteroidales bacterium]|nr:hypothetical protein [Bacteroidales bacterium]
APNYSGKVEYYGIRGLNIGLSGYFGNTQSTLYDGISKSDDDAVARADSSVVGVSLLGLDARYSISGIQLRGQFYYSSLTNTDQYNAFTADESGSLNDVGSAMIGYFAEAGYNILRTASTSIELVPFVRYEFLNTHHAVAEEISENPAYAKTAITTGLTLGLTRGAVVKADVQLLKDASGGGYSNTLNLGVGVMF